MYNSKLYHFYFMIICGRWICYCYLSPWFSFTAYSSIYVFFPLQASRPTFLSIALSVSLLRFQFYLSLISTPSLPFLSVPSILHSILPSSSCPCPHTLFTAAPTSTSTSHLMRTHPPLLSSSSSPPLPYSYPHPPPLPYLTIVTGASHHLSPHCWRGEKSEDMCSTASRRRNIRWIASLSVKHETNIRYSAPIKYAELVSLYFDLNYHFCEFYFFIFYFFSSLFFFHFLFFHSFIFFIPFIFICWAF